MEVFNIGCVWFTGVFFWLDGSVGVLGGTGVDGRVRGLASLEVMVV